MSQEKEYIVSLIKGADFQKFNAEMIQSSGAGYIPNRSVTVANARPGSGRIAHYMLTESEADNLKTDSRVFDVHIPPEDDDNLFLEPMASQTGNFSKTTSDTGPYINWGLRRINEKTNVYGGGSIVSGDYNYSLDGSGVDVVIQDSGIQADHPEFQNANGQSRVKQIDWFSESGLTGTQSASHYRDYDGHGTHVAGIVAGKNYGWAKNADIYALKVAGLEGSGDSGTGIAVSDCFDVIKEWHRRKVSGKYTPTGATYSDGSLTLTLGNHNIESGDKVRIAPGSLTFTSSTDNNDILRNYPKPAETGFYNKDVTVDTVTTTTITVTVGNLSDTGTHTFVSALTGAVQVQGEKRLLKKRPTVVNMSWGYTTPMSGITGGNYRGTAWSGTTARTDYGMVGRNGRHVVRVSSVDVDVEELIDAGVHVCISAGNSKQKIDVETGDDYDNYYTKFNVFTTYYHRGGSPTADDAHIVGNIDSTTENDGGTQREQKSDSSETGPGVTIYAPGTNIMSACSNTNNKSGEPYYFDSDYKQVNISGTSMASPQVAGVLAVYLQIDPDCTPANAKNWIQSKEISDIIYSPGDGTSYTNARSLLAGNNKYLFNPYGSKFGLQMSSLQEGQTSATASSPTYTLTSSAENVNEGGSVTLTLATTNVTAGTSVPYTITGVSTADISDASLTGNFVVGTTDAVTFTIASDTVTEGGETLTLTLDNNEASVSVLINDTSTATATYDLTSTESAVDEGDSFTITLTTTNVANGTNVPYTITGVSSADINNASLTGLFVVGTTNTVTINVTADATTEGVETFNLELDNNQDNIDVTINDTSLTPSAPTYGLTSTTSSVDEGGSFTISLTTTNVVAGTSIPYTITGVQSADIGGASLTGNFVKGTTDSITYNVTADATTEGSETFTMTLDGRSTTVTVGINDTSLTPSGPTYSLTRSTSSVNEGGSFSITLATSNVDSGTAVPYTITGVSSADIEGASLTGNFTVGTQESLTFTVTEDDTTEGTETFSIALNNGEASTTVSINDTSVDTTPTYALTRSASSVDEGSTVTFTLTTTNVANGTNVPFTITGVTSADISNASLTGDFFVNNNTSQLVCQIANDTTTEGSETLTVTLDDSPSVTSSVTINDTSRAPFNADYTISVTNSGNSYTLTGTDRNGAVSGSQPTLAFNNGDLVQFNVNSSTSSSHPFYIKTQSGSGTGYQASGVSGQGTTTLQWTIGSTGTFYYQCSIHGSMNNSISVS